MEIKRIMGKLNWLQSIVTLVLTVFSIAALAGDPSDTNSSSSACKTVLRPFGSKPAFIKDPVTGEWQVSMDPMKYGADGKSNGRGFISAFPTEAEIANDPTVKEFLAKADIDRWALRLVVVPSLKAAEEELNQAPFTYKAGGLDVSMVPVFYVAGEDYESIRKVAVDFSSSHEEANRKFKEYREIHREIFNKMVSPVSAKNGVEESRLFYLSHIDNSNQGKPKMTFSRLPFFETKRLNFETVRFYGLYETGRVMPTFLFPGWVKMPVKGVVKLDEYFANTDRVRELERQARKFFREGIIGSVTFNTSEKAMGEVIEAVRDIDRKGQDKGGGPGAHERFNPVMIERFKQGLKDFTTYSVEVRDPQGKIIGGTFGRIFEGIFDGVSVAYPRLLKWKKDAKGNLILVDGLPVPLYEVNSETGELKRDENGDPIQSVYGIEIARIAKYFLYRKMQAAGFILQDAKMVTEFTKGVGGTYISREELEEAKRISKAKGLDGSKVDWSPITTMPEPRKAEGSRK